MYVCRYKAKEKQGCFFSITLRDDDSDDDEDDEEDDENDDGDDDDNDGDCDDDDVMMVHRHHLLYFRVNPFMLLHETLAQARRAQ